MATSASHDTTPDDTGDAARRDPAAGSRDVAALRRPYPTAPTVTRLSPARATTVTEQTKRARTPSAMPATIWTVDTGTAAGTARRLVPIIERVVAAFALPGAAVAFLPWPAKLFPCPRPGEPNPVASPDELTIDTSTGAALVAAARTAGYAARMLTAPTSTVPNSSPADDNAAGDRERSVGQLAAHVHRSSLDLIVTATSPDRIDEPSADRVALLAAGALRAGGILAVLTHSHQHEAQLQDRTGTVVTAGQNADLLYLQHIVAVHGPVHHLHPEPAAPPERNWHRRVHDDLLVLVQPRDHTLDLPNAAAA